MEQDRLLISNSEKDGNEVSLRSPIDDGEWDELRMILTTYLKGIKSKINELKLARWRADVSQLLSQEIKSWRGLCAVLTKTAHVMKGEFSPWEAIKRVKNNAGTEFTISNGDLVDTLYGKMFEHGVEEHALGSDVAWVEYRYPTDYVLRSTVGSKFKKFTEEWVGSFSRSISKVDEVTVDRINAYMEDFVEIAWQGLHVMHIAWEDITEDNEGSVTVGVDDEELEHYKENVLKQEITYAIPFEQLYNIIDRTLSEYIEQKRAQELERLNNVRNQVRLLVNEVEDRFSPLKD